MTTVKVRDGSSWVTIGGGAGSPSLLFPSALTGDGVSSGSSVRSVITCTADSSAHTWGPWVEVDASLAADVDRVHVFVQTGTGSSANDSSTLLQIGTGGSGSETALATVNVGYSLAGRHLAVPCPIASGTRVAVRCQSVTGSKTVAAVYSFSAAKSVTLGAPITWGADTVNSRGVVLATPAGNNTKGGWTQIAASTGADVSSLGVFPSGAGGAAMGNVGVLIDIAAGGSGSETPIIEDLYLVGGTQETYTPFVPLTFGIDIPAGTRLSARYAAANTSQNFVDLILVGA